MRNSFLCLFVFAVANIGAQNNMADILASYSKRTIPN